MSKKNHAAIEIEKGRTFSYRGNQYSGKVNVGSEGSEGRKLDEAGYEKLKSILGIPADEQGTAPAEAAE